MKNLLPTIPLTHQKAHSVYDAVRDGCLCSLKSRVTESSVRPPLQPSRPPDPQPLFPLDAESLFRQIHPPRMTFLPLGKGGRQEAKCPDVITGAHFHHQNTAIVQASSNPMEWLLFALHPQTPSPSPAPGASWPASLPPGAAFHASGAQWISMKHSFQRAPPQPRSLRWLPDTHI